MCTKYALHVSNSDNPHVDRQSHFPLPCITDPFLPVKSSVIDQIKKNPAIAGTCKMTRHKVARLNFLHVNSGHHRCTQTSVGANGFK